MEKELKDKYIKMLKEFYTKAVVTLSTLDWSNPRIILSAIVVLILPFVAKLYILPGILLGLLLSISALWLVEKSPNIIKKMIVKYPFIADLILSAVVISTVGAFFGSGLILGIGAVFCTIILSYALLYVKLEPEHQEPSTA